MQIKKLLVIGIIFLFIGVTAAPSINKSVVTASQDDDLVKVTTKDFGIEPFVVIRGSVKIHFYEDLDNDSVFDLDEPSPPLFIVRLKIVYPNLVFMINRFKIIGSGGNAIFRFIPYPAIYYLTAHYERVLYGVLWEFWQYNGLLTLDEDTMGTQINLPIRHFGVP